MELFIAWLLTILISGLVSRYADYKIEITKYYLELFVWCVISAISFTICLLACICSLPILLVAFNP